MRWLFLFVLFLNLAYIAWEMNKPFTGSYSNIKTIKNARSIVLLSEVNSRQPVEILQNQTDEVSAKQANSKQIDIDSPDIEQVVTETVDTEQVNIDQAALALMQLELARDEKEGSRVMETASLSQKVLSAQPQQKNDGCYTLGPFRDLGVLRSLTREIKSYVVTVDFRGREVKEKPLYWVYIKPEINRKEAIATGKRLKAKNIKDYYIIRKGENNNGVSLGHFRNKDSAYGLVKRVKKLGFNVVLEPVYKSYTVYWLDYQVTGDVKIPEAIIDKYIKAAKKDRIRRLSRDCAV